MEVCTIVCTREQYESLLKAAELSQESTNQSADVLAAHAPKTAAHHRAIAAQFGNALMALKMNCVPGNVRAELSEMTAERDALLLVLGERPLPD